ncbi:hypothetical protein A0H81_07452 [Grifola frondosa]|uniref:Peptidase S9 prolyl oligopeptidase catalytic domain-containing protein n=1 Tax=Grifola frondosa TaxID=5627 RepID=A0A1C7M6P2_GRIFR|nr:hypothetical protein A0H81_07452 [Grifola frondosa]
MTSKQNLIVGGIQVNVYSDTVATPANTPIAVLFLLHGRTGSAEQIDWVARSTLEEIRKLRDESKAQTAQDLYVVTFDHRNHGTRLVDDLANQGWSNDAKENNDRHASDIWHGPRCVLSHRLLTPYLFPSDERTVSQWLVAGISLGGHSTWLTLRNEVKLGIPIIGCPDYSVLITKRAEEYSLPIAPPYFPQSLVQLLKNNDPAAAPYTATDASNPFLGKKVLVLCGADDHLVPWTASKQFVDNLQVGEGGVKTAIIAPGVGHKCTANMVREMAKFIWAESLLA